LQRATDRSSWRRIVEAAVLSESANLMMMMMMMMMMTRMPTADQSQTTTALRISRVL